MTNKKTYTQEEALAASTEYFDGDTLAANVAVTKYLLKNKEGELVEKTPEEMEHRIASEFARIEAKFGGPRALSYEKIREHINKFGDVVPQGSPMYGIGNNYSNMSLSNCVVIAPPDDTMSSIMDAGKDLANLFKRRCGVGVDISELRPSGAAVSNSAGTSSGAFSFADYFSYVCRMVGQNGRRGALMISMDIRHPDVFEFIRMKQNLGLVTGANVSLRAGDDFFEALENGEQFKLQWPVESENPEIERWVDPKEIWTAICEAATFFAEPGLIFWDNILRKLPAHMYEIFKTVGLNPCGEINLSAYDSCRLISLNLLRHILNMFESGAEFDFESYAESVRIAMRLMDDLVELEIEKLTNLIEISDTEDEKELWQKLLQACINGRRTGLGTHALADALAQLCLRYDSDEAVEMVSNIYRAHRDAAYRESVELAKERGSFPVFNWDTEKDNEFIQALPEDIKADMAIHGRRNISLLTIAPTGSVSICSQTSSGIEPVFRNSYTRRRKLSYSDTDEPDFVDSLGDRWQEYKVYHHNAQLYMEKYGVAEEDLPDFFVESDSIDWINRVELQAAAQEFIDHSISSTINLPKGTTPEQVGEIYLQAWRKGLKGVTVYVDGSRDGVLITNPTESNFAPEAGNLLPSLINAGCTDEEAETTAEGVIVRSVKLTDEFVNGPTAIIKREGAKFYLHLSYLPNDNVNPIAFWVHSNHLGNSEYVSLNRAVRAIQKELMEQGVDTDLVLDQVEKIKGDQYHERLGKMISMALRHNIPMLRIVSVIDNIEGDYISSTLTAVRKFLKTTIQDGVKTGTACTACGSDNVIFEGGCDKCNDCGNSGCS